MSALDQAHIQEQLRAKGVDVNHIRSLHVKLAGGELHASSFVIPETQLTLPTNNDVIQLAAASNAATKGKGVEALRKDELAVFWLNGGAATRYFDDAKVTADERTRYAQQLSEVEAMRQWPKGVTPVVRGMSYIELKLRNLLEVKHRFNLISHPHVILMNSFVTDQATRDHLQLLYKKYPELEPSRFHFVVQQPRIPRFNKASELKDIDLFIAQSGELSWAPCGHGDFVYLLQDYLRHTPLPGVKHLFFSNVDNIAATLSPTLFGLHCESNLGRTVELVSKAVGDQGGMPCKVNGEMVVVEQMKFPGNFPIDQIPWMNTNTFWFKLDSLLNFSGELPWVIAEKSIPEGTVWQLEHFACDVQVPSQYIVVDRTARFWPVKRYVDILRYQDAAHEPELAKPFNQLLQDRFGVAAE